MKFSWKSSTVNTKLLRRLSVMIHACHPNTLKVEAGVRGRPGIVYFEKQNKQQQKSRI